VISWNRFYDPATGRYISADPIGLRGGINLYSYANQNPINKIDPLGLYSYHGYCRYISGGVRVGVGVLRCKIWTDCVDGKRQRGEIVSMVGGATTGLPVGLTYFNINLEDGRSSGGPSLSNLEGPSHVLSLGGAAGGGHSYYNIRLGEGRTPDYQGGQAGGDLSGDAFFGASWISNEWFAAQLRTESCCESE